MLSPEESRRLEEGVISFSLKQKKIKLEKSTTAYQTKPGKIL